MKTLIATQAVSFSPRGSLQIDAATDGNGPVWADNFRCEFIEAFCLDNDSDIESYFPPICRVSFKNPLYVQSTDSCSDEDAPGARELIRAAAVAAISSNDTILLRCAIAYRERQLNAGRAGSDDANGATDFIKEQCKKMDLEFCAETLAKYGSVRYNQVLRNIADKEWVPVPFPE